MKDWMPLLQFLHIAGLVAWVGGMFFAHLCLRPIATRLFEPPQRLALMAGVFSLFFPWVWAATACIFITGLSMMSEVGFRAAPSHWHLMLGSGLVMMGIFAYIYFLPYPRLRAGVSMKDWQVAAAALNRIRNLVAINLMLGFLTIAVATLGRYLAT